MTRYYLKVTELNFSGSQMWSDESNIGVGHAKGH